jgi:spore coat protein A
VLGVAAALVAAPALRRLFPGGAEAGARAAARLPGSGLVCGGASITPPSAPPPVRAPLHPDALAPFVDPLPIPRVLAPVAKGQYRVTMREAEVRIHRDLPPTPMWTYDGTMPGPTIEARRGEAIDVTWVNALPRTHFLPIDRTLHGAGPELPEVRAAVHVHGAKAPPESDGYPENWIVPGGAATARYPNDQDAATLWYHDHAMGLERLNQYAGLLGCYLVRDDVEDALDLPRGEHEIPLVLTDRLLTADASLLYPTSDDPRAPWVPEVLGDALLVNGKLRPFVDVAPRAYRLRVVNASNGRTFTLGFADGRTLFQIGTDQGLLAAPAVQRTVRLAPGERADIVIDLADAAGERLVLRTLTLPLLELRVARLSVGARAKTWAPPARLRPIAALRPESAALTRTLTLDEYHDPIKGRMLMLLGGRYWHEPVTERPVLGSTEVWSFVNTTEDTHPIHLHLVRFQILDRQPFDVDEYNTSGKMEMVGPPVPPEPGEAGWKDTVRAEPGMITRIIARFEGYAGRYVWHCHVLEHAANGMMRPFEVVEG